MKNIEEYTKNLSPELQEKARACTDFADLMKLAAANDVELNTDQLEAVAGGKLIGMSLEEISNL